MTTLPRKHRNQNYNAPKFDKYQMSKQRLINFKPALNFVERLETFDNGFYISPRTNLHCYYKDSYLFYFHAFDKRGIKISQEFNNLINKGTYDNSKLFFDKLSFLLDNKVNDIDISKTIERVNTFEIYNTANSHQYFDDILEAMDETAKEIDSSSLDFLTIDFDRQVKQSLNSSQPERLIRLQSADKYPTVIQRTVIAFNRNPDVVAETLFRANGKCERCKKAAPFLRQLDNSPYLEVHHIERLADGGEDTIDNTIALCANCHREAHFGGLKLKRRK